ncbi:MAG: hypothetical protein NTV70_20635 [Acidobacteria bacterium]|nr:hypothetical protein [Acidobacteriota bacterium]
MSPETMAWIGSMWPYLLAGLLVLTAVVLFIVTHILRRESQAAPPSVAPAAGDAPAEAPESAAAAADYLPASFAQSLNFLRQSTGAPDYRYRVPWTLVLGSPQSGVSTLLASAGPNLAIEGTGEVGAPSGVEWRFLEQGLLLGVPGNFFFSDSGRAKDDKGWQRLMELLISHRARRPLDGMVLAIPAADLWGPAALDEPHLSARAAVFCEHLAQAQKMLGFTFPVYVAVTKCDEIPGFQAFCSELPANTHDQIFGWSSPYNLEATFNADWVAEAFNTIGRDLQRLQSEILVGRTGLARPDEVFLFPQTFGRLAAPLRIYLERLFRESAYREAFRFRGIYFSGDLSVPGEGPPPLVIPEAKGALRDWSKDDDLPPAVTAAPAPPRRKSAFVRALFEHKVFPESGLAQPLSKVFLSRNRTVLAIQAASLVLALVLGIGTTLAYRRLAEDRDRVVPMLQQMQRMDEALPSERHALLRAMAPVGPVRFKSSFMPTSLWSGVDDSITEVMTYACNRWVLTNLRASLEAKVEKLLTDQELILEKAAAQERARNQQGTSRDEIDGARTSIEALQEYRAILDFVAALKLLSDNRDIYEALRQPGVADREGGIRRLVQYLYALPLGEVAPNGHLDLALKAAHGAPFEVSDQAREQAATLLRRLTVSLFDEWFGRSLLLDDTEVVKEKMSRLEQARTASYDDLQEALYSLKQLESDLNNPGFLWVGSDRLDVTGPLRRILIEPRSSARLFIRDDAAEATRTQGEEQLRRLRKRLADQRTTITGAVLEVKDTVRLSRETQLLEEALQNALMLRFMSMKPQRDISTKLVPKTRLIWRMEPLQEALRLHDIYDRFSQEGLRDSPDRLRSLLERVAISRLNLNARDLIAQSQEFQPSDERPESEDETLAEVTSFRESSEAINQLGNRFKKLRLTDAQNRLNSIRVAQAYNLLATLERRLQEEDPYEAQGVNFGWWDGKGSVSLRKYEVRNPIELNEYLASQRDRLKNLAEQAEPVVEFLRKGRAPGEPPNPLAGKWQQIVADFKQYDGKKPGASISALEEFILNEMDKITPETSCATAVPIRDTRDPRMDYFQQIRSTMRKAVYERCLSLGSENVYAAYTVIADQFNRTLAKQFPFAPLSADRTQPEAAPEAIAEFYRLLDQTGKTARATLEKSTRFESSRAPALQFLDQMDRLRPLVVPASPEAEKEPPLTLDVVPAFRANQALEVAGNQIIEWTLQMGGQIFRQQEPEHPGRWRTGNPIRLSLRWANDSPSLPVADSRQPNLRLSGRGVIFEHTNRWALYSFLKRHEAPASDAVRANDPKPYLLRLNIRTAPDPKWAKPEDDRAASNATVFLYFRVYLPGTKVPLTLPVFPEQAPSLKPPSAP